MRFRWRSSRAASAVLLAAVSAAAALAGAHAQDHAYREQDHGLPHEYQHEQQFHGQESWRHEAAGGHIVEPEDEFKPHIAARVEHATFSPPFSQHDPYGKRILPNWSIGGDAIIKQSFVRLTPDKKHSRGTVWSTAPIGSTDFSVEWKFRISGMDEHAGGDNLSLWITDKAVPPVGSVFGFADWFTGIGLVLDTNRAPGDGRHRDISLVTNNGRKDSSTVMSELTGCNANLRYWEGRDDFNVLKSSRLRLKYSNNSIQLEVDSRNTGRWRRCATIPRVDLPNGWAQHATVGLMAINDASSNNNDVLGLKVFTDPESVWALERYSGEEEEDGDWSLLVHHIEHEMFTVHTNLKSTIQQLEEAEEAAEHRITALEHRLASDITQALEERMAALEAQVHRSVSRSVHSRISSVERGMSDKMETTLAATVTSATRAWRTPFYLLVGAVGAMCIMAYFKYRELKKEHLL